MASRALDGRYGSARHAVADDLKDWAHERAGGAGDDRSLVDRFLDADAPDLEFHRDGPVTGQRDETVNGSGAESAVRPMAGSAYGNPGYDDAIVTVPGEDDTPQEPRSRARSGGGSRRGSIFDSRGDRPGTPGPERDPAEHRRDRDGGSHGLDAARRRAFAEQDDGGPDDRRAGEHRPVDRRSAGEPRDGQQRPDRNGGAPPRGPEYLPERTDDAEVPAGERGRRPATGRVSPGGNFRDLVARARALSETALNDGERPFRQGAEPSVPEQVGDQPGATGERSDAQRRPVAAGAEAPEPEEAVFADPAAVGVDPFDTFDDDGPTERSLSERAGNTERSLSERAGNTERSLSERAGSAEDRFTRHPLAEPAPTEMVPVQRPERAAVPGDVAPVPDLPRVATHEPTVDGPQPGGVEDYAARRRAREAAAAAAESAAAEAAERASAAIAAAARAAEEAEEAAEAAARAAEDARAAAEAEAAARAGSAPVRRPEPPRRAAVAEQQRRPDQGPGASRRPPEGHPGRRPERVPPPEAPEPDGEAPTQAVPLIAPGPDGRRGGQNGQRPGEPGRPDEPAGAEGRRPRRERESDAGATGVLREGRRPVQAPDQPAAGATTVAPLMGSPRERGGRGDGGEGGQSNGRPHISGENRHGKGEAPTDRKANEEAQAPRRSAHRETGGTGRRRAADTGTGEHGKPAEKASFWAGLTLTSKPMLAAFAVAAVLLIAAFVVFLTNRSAPPPAPPQPGPATVVQVPSVVPANDPASPKAVAFLDAMRAAEIPTSRSGQAEVEAARAICDQLGQGADAAQLARSVPAVLPDVRKADAPDVVEFAEKHYC